MTREELFRAVGEVREDQIEAAEVTKRQVHPWRRFGALAACLALVVTVAAAPELREADQWKWTAIVKSFNPGAEVSEDPDGWKAVVRPFNPGEADSGGETEAGTTQRDVVRMGVVSIPASFSVSPKWLKLLTGFKQKEKLTVDYFDTETLEIKRTEMYISGYKASLVKDTSYKGLWKVSFTLKEF